MTLSPIDVEIARVNALSRRMVTEYTAWSDKLAYPSTQQALYDEIFDFVNFRVETVESSILLAENNRVADSLGLSRSVLENYLLLMLICRGRKYFQLQDLTSLTKGDFKKRFELERAQLAERQAANTTECVEVAVYPRQQRHLMYVFEGLKNEAEPDFVVPRHYFLFQHFRPATMRLADADYFVYYQPEAELSAALKEHKDEAASSYRHYLSYDALLQNLELNGIVDVPARKRVEAHFTFLGTFLHPTHDAARKLHDRSNVHEGGTRSGMRQPYSKVATLLASLYSCFLLAGVLGEAARLVDDAPDRHFAERGTETLRALTESVPIAFPYFWFLFNEAPLYDKFMHCIHHVSDEDLAGYGGYPNVPTDLVAFESNIYAHLGNALNGASNGRCGHYRSPLIG